MLPRGWRATQRLRAGCRDGARACETVALWAGAAKVIWRRSETLGATDTRQWPTTGDASGSPWQAVAMERATTAACARTTGRPRGDRALSSLRRAGLALALVGAGLIGSPGAGRPCGWVADAAAAPRLAASEVNWVTEARSDLSLVRADGRWRHDGAGVGLQSPAGDRKASWVLVQPEVADGFIRFRLRGARPKHLGLLVRATASRPTHVGATAGPGAVARPPAVAPPPEAAQRLDGYHLALRGDAIAWMRWDAGVLRPLGVSARAPGLGRLGEVEVAIWAVGPHLSAQVYDGATLAPLAAVSVSDGAHRVGGAGIVQFSRGSTATVLEHIGVQAAATQASPPARSGAAPAAPRPLGPTVSAAELAPADPAAWAPAGPWRVVALPPAALSAMPDSLRAQVQPLAWIPVTAGGVAVRATPPVAERVRRWWWAERRQELALVAIDTPFMMVAPRMVQTARPGAAAKTTGGDAAAKDAASGDLAGSPTAAIAQAASERYHDAAATDAAMRALAARTPWLQRFEIGRSREGRPLVALRVMSPDAADRERALPVLLAGAHHGDELAASAQVLDAAAQICEALTDPAADPALRGWLARLEVWLVPMVNPDGVETFLRLSGHAGRKNRRPAASAGVGAATARCETAGCQVAGGVDLNRNFPFRWGALGELASAADPLSPYHRGDRPGSEPETQAMMRLAEHLRPVAALSYHTVATAILWPYTTDGVADTGAAAMRGLASELAQATPRQPNGKRFRVIQALYPVDGVDQDWMRAALGTAALLVEGPGQNPTTPTRLRAELVAVRPTWRALLRRLAEGPVLVERLVAPGGAPIGAEVELSAEAPLAGERWRNRCRDGALHRLWSAPLPSATATGAESAPSVTLRPARPGFGAAASGPASSHEQATVADLSALPEPADGGWLRLPISARGAVSAWPLHPGDCADAALCSVAARCQAKAAAEALTAGAWRADAACVRLESGGGWCEVDGRCVRATGDDATAGCGCRPALDAFAWTDASGQRCAALGSP